MFSQIIEMFEELYSPETMIIRIAREPAQLTIEIPGLRPVGFNWQRDMPSGSDMLLTRDLIKSLLKLSIDAGIRKDPL